MSFSLVTSAATSTDDGPAIAELHRVHAIQRSAFVADPFPSATARRQSLAALARMIVGHRSEIRAAMADDFAVHPELFSDLVEVLGVAGRAAYALEQLDDWMAD